MNRQQRHVAAICRLWQRVPELTEEEEADCVICQEPLLGDGEVPVRLPCSHMFSAACIQAWVIRNHTCPLCRRNYYPELSRPENQRPVTDNEEDHPFLLEDYNAALARTEAIEEDEGNQDAEWEEFWAELEQNSIVPEHVTEFSRNFHDGTHFEAPNSIEDLVDKWDLHRRSLGIRSLTTQPRQLGSGGGTLQVTDVLWPRILAMMGGPLL